MTGTDVQGRPGLTPLGKTERQKATRLYKRAMKALRACEDDSPERARLETIAKAAEIDLNYTRYHPLMLPYISLYADRGDDDRDEGSNEDGGEGKAGADAEGARSPATVQRRGDVHVRGLIVEAMEKGTLEKLRDRSDVEEIARRRAMTMGQGREPELKERKKRKKKAKGKGKEGKEEKKEKEGEAEQREESEGGKSEEMEGGSQSRGVETAEEMETE